ncbi:MAG: ribonuclease H-like domain-containing protein [Trueperaceae bacterium]
MSDLLQRLRALRGEAPASEGSPPAPSASPASPRADYGPSAARLGAEVVNGPDGSHLLRRQSYGRDARHGSAPIGASGPAASVHPWFFPVQAHAVADGPVAFVDAETTGLAGGTGTYAFLVGVGTHGPDGFEVRQVLLPGPQHERSQLLAVAALLADAAAVVSYNGASFDLPLLRTRFALHDLPDPFAARPHLDLLPWARRLWRLLLPSCTLAEVERAVLQVRREHGDVPGAEVPARYRAFLRTSDAEGLRGVLAHNRDDVVALAALRARIEATLMWAAGADVSGPTHAVERYGIGRHLEATGRTEAALRCYRSAERDHPPAAWDAARLLRRSGRASEAVERWHRLAGDGDARAWIALAKHHEHRLRDPHGALRAVRHAERTGGARYDDLASRRARLEAKRDGPG